MAERPTWGSPRQTRRPQGWSAARVRSTGQDAGAGLEELSQVSRAQGMLAMWSDIHAARGPHRASLPLGQPWAGAGAWCKPPASLCPPQGLPVSRVGGTAA